MVEAEVEVEDIDGRLVTGSGRLRSNDARCLLRHHSESNSASELIFLAFSGTCLVMFIDDQNKVSISASGEDHYYPYHRSMRLLSEPMRYGSWLFNSSQQYQQQGSASISHILNQDPKETFSVQKKARPML